MLIVAISVVISLLMAEPVAAHDQAAVLPPNTSGSCTGEIPIVVASDAEAQSDIYSAATLAGVLGTDCIVLAGRRNQRMSSVQERRLDDAATGGYIVGGVGAVPASKTRGHNLYRLGGSDRWETARLVGEEARFVASGGSRTGTSTLSTVATTANARSDQILTSGSTVYVEVRYQVGVDLRPGVWTDSPDSDRSDCRFGLGSGGRTDSRSVNINGTDIENVGELPLRSGDVLTLQSWTTKVCSLVFVRA